jgi:hypothetical protein
MNKRLLTGFFILAVLSGCETDLLASVEEIGTRQTGGSRWTLAGMGNPWTGEYREADSLSFWYAYEFNADSTFMKYSSEGDTASGFYRDFEDQYWYRELTFTKGDIVISNCSGDGEFMRQEDEYLVVDIRPCDGPKYFYLNVIN